MSTENKKKSFLVHFDKRRAIESLIVHTESGAASYDRIGRLFMALMDFAENGSTTVELDGMTSMAYYMMSEQISQDIKKYNAIREKRREAINKRWNEHGENDTNVYTCIQMNTSDTDTVTVTDTDTDTDNNTTTTTTRSLSDAQARTREHAQENEAPSTIHIAQYFEDNTDMTKSQAMEEARKFYAFNESLKWKCLPMWEVAADSWAKQINTRERS